MPAWDTIASRIGVTADFWRRPVAALVFVAVTLLGLAFCNEKIERFFWYPDNWKIWLPFIGATVLAAAFIRMKSDELTPILRACIRASAVGLTVLLALERPDYTLADPGAALAGQYVSIAYFAALAFSVLSWFRPAFVLPVAIFLLSTRLLVLPISGVEMSFLDIRYMIDMSLYAAVMGVVVVKVGPRIHPWLGSEERQNEIVGVVFGLHLANYFWSGIAKMDAGPTPWYWIFNNHTFNQIPYTAESGILPIGHLPLLTNIAYHSFQFTYIPLNAMIVLAQLFAIICVLRIGWLKITSVMYEFLHVGIFILGGLFFWPWVWNNITIWWAARTAKKGLAWNTKLACIATIILGAPALHLNEAAFLAWFDVADARQVYFEAVTEDGRTVKVPSAFFNSHSYSMSHAYLGSQEIRGQYKWTMLGSTDSVDRNEKDGECADPPTLESIPLETAEERTGREKRMMRFITAHHKKMLAREDSFGRGTYYFHVHHHPSNPFLYKEFNKLSLHDVVGYQQVMESSCHRMVDGRVEKQVKARDTEYVDVR